MWWSVRTVVGLVGLGAVLGGAVPASAQVRGIGIEGGYRFQRLSGGGTSVNYPEGLGLAVTVPVTRAVDVVALLDFSQKTVTDAPSGSELTDKWQDYGVGVRWKVRRAAGATPYVQGGFGVTRNSGDIMADGEGLLLETTFYRMMQVGAGVRTPLAGPFSAFAQVDYRRVATEPTGTNDLGVLVGLRLTLN